MLNNYVLLFCICVLYSPGSEECLSVECCDEERGCQQQQRGLPGLAASGPVPTSPTPPVLTPVPSSKFQPLAQAPVLTFVPTSSTGPTPVPTLFQLPFKTLLKPLPTPPKLANPTHLFTRRNSSFYLFKAWHKAEMCFHQTIISQQHHHRHLSPFKWPNFNTLLWKVWRVPSTESVWQAGPEEGGGES